MKQSEKKRLDVLLVERGLVSGRDRARGVIMAGQVFVDHQKADKPGMQISSDCAIEVRGPQIPYVSRGGLKLQKAVETFDLRLQDLVCADIGASTGGFTDCMLQHGAACVYAIDVGYGQLDWKLRNDARVVVLERTNIRYVTEQQVPDPLDFCSVDVSFISLALVLPVMKRLLKADGQAVCLVKPQFEAGRDKVGKKGVVRDPAVHAEVIQKVWDHAVEQGFQPHGLSWSPITGPEGNIEYLLYLQGTVPAVDSAIIQHAVDDAHRTLRGNP